MQLTVKHLRDLLATVPQDAHVAVNDGDSTLPLHTYNLTYRGQGGNIVEVVLDLTAIDEYAAWPDDDE